MIRDFPNHGNDLSCEALCEAGLTKKEIIARVREAHFQPISDTEVATEKKPTVGVFYVVVGAIASGFAVPLVKYNEQISVPEFASARAGLTLLLLGLIYGRHVARELWAASREELYHLVGYGVMFSTAIIMGYYMFRFWTVSMSLSIISLIPFFGIVYGWYKGHQVDRRTKITAAVLVTSTIIALLNITEQEQAPRPVLGCLLAIGCNICYIWQAQLIKATERISWQSRVTVFGAVFFLMSVIAAVVFSEPLYGKLAVMQMRVAIPLVGVGLFSGYIYFASVNLSTHHLKVEIAMTLQMIELPIWLVVATVGYGESLTPIQWSAIVMAIVATTVLSYLTAKPKQGESATLEA